MLRKNEGTVDRAIRIVVGAALASVGLFVLDGLQGSVVGIVAAAFGFWFVLTGAIGICPLYIPFGFNTLGRQDRVTSSSRTDALIVHRTREGAAR
jgi:Protein of unknown function (DUF2892)